MYKQYLFALLLSGLSFSIAPLSQAQECGVGNFMIDEEGNCIDLNDWGNSRRERQIVTSTQNSFPNWLIDNDQFSIDEQYQTGAKILMGLQHFAYQNRYILQVRGWRRTASSGEIYTLRYYDCFTGWIGVRDFSRDDSIDRVEFLDPTTQERRELVKNKCQNMKITTNF